MEWPLLADVPPDDLRHVLSVARRRTFRKGEVVFHRGDPADALHLITRGRFAARAATLVGDNVLLSVMGPGDAFGELALVGASGIRSATVAALETGETLSITRPDFAALLERHPRVQAVLTGLLAEQVARISERLIEALSVDAERRVLRRLLELSDVYGGQGDQAVIPLTQEELAGLAGTSRETVNRVLREEARRGTVTLGRGRTVVVDRQELSRRARPAAL